MRKVAVATIVALAISGAPAAAQSPEPTDWGGVEPSVVQQLCVTFRIVPGTVITPAELSGQLAAGEVDVSGITAASACLPDEETPDPEPDLTVDQENAIETAWDYLDFMAFSRKGLIDQLIYEDFSRKDAKFAVDYIDVDWREQAYLSGLEYLDSGSFSRKGLIDQLIYEGFSKADATHGADAARAES